MATNLNVTELDFDDIKNNLKNFLKQQTEFNDAELKDLEIIINELSITRKLSL